MRRFKLIRAEDETGVSGVGEIAEGVMFSDGTCALRWRTKLASTALYPDMQTLMAIHGHQGKTKCVWIDDDVLVFSEHNGPFDRGRCDALQDRIENCQFASVGGNTDEPRLDLRAPKYIGADAREEYMRGYCF